MVNDNEIKTKVSPFAMREGEIKVFDGKDGYVAMNNIVGKINSGQINELHFKILELINEFEFMTSRQLYQLLEMNGFSLNGQDKLNNKLEQMIKVKLLTRYYFKSEDGQGIYRIYCMEKMGKYILNSREIESKWQATDNVKPIDMIKKRLAGNQTIIAYLQKVGISQNYVPKPTLPAKALGKKFKVTGGSIDLTKNDKSLTFIFEVVRREENWVEKFADKMRLYNDFYDNFVSGDGGYAKKPQIIFICEDDKHMAETFKVIVANKLEIKGVPLYFSTDLKQIEENLSKSLIQFKLDENTNKYKIENLEIKILG